jgi:hypothetical protein
MKTRKLKPEQIIVPGEYELGNESILKIYFRIFEKRHGKDLPPAVVTRLMSRDERKIREWLEDSEYGFRKWEEKRLANILPYGTLEARRRDYENLFKILEKSPYMLIDGNHKTAAATLAHKPISALEIQTDEDLKEVRKMVERGELFDFKRDETSIYHLRRSFIAYCLELNIRENDGNITFLSGGRSWLRYTKSVKERIDELASNGDLPQYMKERYFKN